MLSRGLPCESQIKIEIKFNDLFMGLMEPHIRLTNFRYLLSVYSHKPLQRFGNSSLLS